MLRLLLIACVLLLTSASRAPDEPFYLVAVSSTAVGGSSERLCAQITHGTNPEGWSRLKVTLKIRGVPSQPILDARSSYDGCVQFPVPVVLTDTVATVCAVVQWGRTGGRPRGFSKTTKILIRPSSLLTIIQTDKPIYKPGQTIKFRIVSMDTSFLPKNETFRTVDLTDPRSYHIGQWLNQIPSFGILSLSFQTNSEARLGVYTIRATNERGQETIKTFEIREYVLPRFEVTVYLPDVISTQDTEVEVKTCGKYTYGRPVQGSVTTQVCVEPEYFLRSPLPMPPGPSTCITFTMETDLFGCAARNIAMSIFNMTSIYYLGNFIVESALEEEGTGVILTGTGRGKITTTVVSLEFQDISSTFRRGIAITGKVVIRGAGPSQVADRYIHLQARYGSTIKNIILNSDHEGVARFSLDTRDVDANSIVFQAGFVDEWDTWAFRHRSADLGRPEHMITSHTAYKFYSESNSFLQIKHVKGPNRCDDNIQVEAFFFIQGGLCWRRESQDFYFLVVSRGTIVQSGTLSVGLHGEDSVPVKTGTLFVPLQEVDSLGPYAQVVVHTVLTSGEVVADSFDVPMPLCFQNKVSLQFSSPQLLPGGQAVLHLQALPDSRCSLRAIDHSVLLLRPDGELTAQKVYDKLPISRMFGYPFEVMDPEPRCTLPEIPPPDISRRKRSIFPYYYIKNDAKSMFERVGIKLVTNLDIQDPQHCREEMAPSPFVTAVEEDRTEEIIRTFFPETWIWDLITIEDSGTATVELPVPDTITTWKASLFCTSPAGFGLATGTSLMVFQPFFVRLTLPYSVVRLEVFPLRATVFNYLSGCIMVTVSLRDSEQFTARPLEGATYRRCVCAQESATFTWVLTATTLGRVEVSVSAAAEETTELCGVEAVTLPDPRIDTVVGTLLVDPEGREQTVSENALLCPQGGAEVEVTIVLPEITYFVVGSMKGSVSVLGDLMGRALENLESLLALPSGCGEQNMLKFAPNIFILNYLVATGQLTEETQSKAIGFLEKGYQNQLNYMHSDGSYSAFGTRDPTGNTWLTAFVMKSFGGAARHVFIDQEYITGAKEWLRAQQREDGCMNSVGKLFNNRMKGGVSDEVMLTAYVTAAFLELGTSVTDPFVTSSLNCLRDAAAGLPPFNAYPITLLSYTFSLAGDRQYRDLLFTRLDTLANNTEHGRHWGPSGASGRDSLAVEMTAYVVLARLSGRLSSPGDLVYTVPIVRWLVRQQNPNGGFSSTQDTVVALQALTLYAAEVFERERGSTRIVTVSTGGVLRVQFQVTEQNRLLYQEERLPEVPGGVYTVKAIGNGCAYVQITLRYNVLPPPLPSSFAIKANATGVCNSENKTSLTVFVDASYDGAEDDSNMVIIAIRLLSGYIVNARSLIQLRNDVRVSRVELDGSYVIVYLNEMKKGVPMLIALKVNEHIKIHGLRPAAVMMYDYYNIDDRAFTTYTSPCTVQNDEDLSCDALDEPHH